MVQPRDSGQQTFGAGHIQRAGRKQKIDLRIHVDEDGLHARFLRVRSMSAVKSLLCLTGHGSAGSRLRSDAGRLAERLGGARARGVQVRQRFHQLSAQQHRTQHGLAVAAFAGARQHVVVLETEELLGAGQRSLILAHFAVKRLMPQPTSSSTSL